MGSFFRPEALEHREREWLGSIQLIRPVSFSVLTAFALLVAMAVGAFLFFGEYTRKVRVSGFLVPDRDLIRLVSPQVATVAESHVTEGATVHRGDVLFVLAAAPTMAGDDDQAIRQPRPVAHTRGPGLEEQRGERIEHSRIAAIARQLDQVRHELESMPVPSRGSLPRTDPAPGAFERDSAALTQDAAGNVSARRIVVRAPMDGVVSDVHAETGQAVLPAMLLANLLPAEAKLQAQLYAPSGAIGYLQARQSVELRYDAFPYQKFGHQQGEVAQVARSPLRAPDLAALVWPARVGGSGEPLYRITVALDRQSVNAAGQEQALAPGMQLEADILLDHRRLFEWLFEPAIGTAGKG